MYNYSKRTEDIEKTINDILHGDVDKVARKHIGISADRMDRKQKDKALAELYTSMQKELEEARSGSTAEKLKKERLENEMSRIRHENTDTLIKNPSISRKEKEKILAGIYDVLQREYDGIGKEVAVDTKPTPLSQTPDMDVATRIQPVKYSNTLGNNMTERAIEANMQEILHGDTDTFLKNNAEMYGFSYDPDMSAAEKEDILGCIYDTLEENRQNLKASENKTQPEIKEADTSVSTKEPSASVNNESTVSEIEYDMNEILHGDKDYVIETYASKYGIEYDRGYMSEEYKDALIKDIYSSAEYDYKKALGKKNTFTFEAQSEKL